MRVLDVWRTKLCPTGERLGHIQREDGTVICKTLEKKWVDANHDGISDKGVSCIPAGKYLGRRVYSPKHKREVFELTGVKGRANIQFHSGVIESHSEGCVLTGLEHGVYQNKPAVLNGKLGEAALMKELEGVDECWFVFTDRFQAMAA